MKHFSAVVIAVGLFCLTCGNAEAGWVKTILPSASGSSSLSTSGNRLAVGSHNSPTRVYDWNGAGWTQLGGDMPSGYLPSLSSTGNTMAVVSGTTLNIFDWNGSSWTQTGEGINGVGGTTALSSNGSRVVVGHGSGGTNHTGQVMVYEWNGTAWYQLGDTLEGDAERISFGISTAISGAGTRIAVGAVNADSGRGSVTVFDWNGSTWAQVGAKIPGDGGIGSSSMFGVWVALSQDGNRVAGSTPYGRDTNNQDQVGFVKVFAWNGGAWGQMGTRISAEGFPDFTRTGISIDLSSNGNRVVQGSAEGPSRKGYASVYDWNGSDWSQVGETILGDTANEGLSSVSLTGAGTRIAVSSSSSVRIYDYDASVTTTSTTGTTDTNTSTDTTSTNTSTDTTSTNTSTDTTDTSTNTTSADTSTDTTTDTTTTDTTTSDAPDTTSGAPTGVLENPGPSASKSGIGVISGWVCEGSIVEVVIDGITVVASYGTERSDTAGLCGDTNNGFAALYNWNRFGDGSHTAIAYVDGIQFDSSTFSVTTFGTEFLTGAAGTYTIDNFPQAGISTTLTWSQSAQNFVISNVDP